MLDAKASLRLEILRIVWPTTADAKTAVDLVMNLERDLFTDGARVRHDREVATAIGTLSRDVSEIFVELERLRRDPVQASPAPALPSTEAAPADPAPEADLLGENSPAGQLAPPDRLGGVEDRVLDLLWFVATAGEACPTDLAIAERLGLSGRSAATRAIGVLVDAQLVTIERSGPKRRVLVNGASSDWTRIERGRAKPSEPKVGQEAEEAAGEAPADPDAPVHPEAAEPAPEADVEAEGPELPAVPPKMVPTDIAAALSEVEREVLAEVCEANAMGDNRVVIRIAGITSDRSVVTRLRALGLVDSSRGTQGTQATELGRTVNEALGNRPPPNRAKDRKCLGCGTAFPSSGPGHRICDQCKTSDTYRSSAMAV